MESKKAKNEAEKEAEAKWLKILDDTNTKNDKEKKLLKTQYDQVQKGLNDANRKINQTSMNKIYLYLELNPSLQQVIMVIF